MDQHCDDTTGSLVDQWWNDSLFDTAFQTSMATPETDIVHSFPSPSFSPFDVGSIYDGGCDSPSGLKHEPEEHLLSEPAASPPALSPSVASTTSTAPVTEIELFQEASRLSMGQGQPDSLPLPGHKRSRSQSTDTSRKLRRSFQTISSSRSSSVSSDDTPVACVHRTSTKTVPGTRQPLASRKLAPATISSPRPEAGERKPGPVGHNAVEKRYRDKINAQFHRLLSVLPNARPEDDDGRSLSKASILELALQAVQNLERENQVLYQQVEQLKDALRFWGYGEGQPQDLRDVVSM